MVGDYMYNYGFPNREYHTEMELGWVLSKLKDFEMSLEEFKDKYYSPKVVKLKSDMADKTQIYLYVGEESGMSTNHWYYWNGSEWIDGGEYGALDVSSIPKIGYNFRKIDRQFIENDGTNSYNLQGGCMVSETKVVYALLDYNYLTNSIAHIIEHDLSAHTFTELGTLTIGHCDSMAFDTNTNTLYIAPAYKVVNGTEVQDGNIYKYAYPSLTLTGTLTNRNANSVAYDIDNSIMYYTTFNNEWKTESGTKLFDFDTSWTDSRQASFKYKDGYYLVTAFPNNIREFDIHGNIVRDIPIASEYNWFVVGEVQFASCINDRLVFGSMVDCEDGTEKYPSFWETNLATNIYPTYDWSAYHIMTTCYVDSSSTSPCPTGDSGHKFKSINEAMLYMNLRGTIHEVDFASGTYKGRINCNCSLIGNGTTVIEPTFKACVARLHGFASVNNAVIADGCYVESDIEFTPTTGHYYNTKAYTENASGSGWTYSTTSNFIRGRTCYLKIAMESTAVPSASWTVLITGYPKPQQNWFMTRIDKTGQSYRVKIDTDGQLSIANLGSDNLKIDDTFVYPI